jgi:tetratricopeptide (TPR) repeat protein
MRLTRPIFTILVLITPIFARDIKKEIEKLIEKGKYSQAENLIYEAQAQGEYSPDLQILLARIFFLRKDYKNTYETIMSIEPPQDATTKSKLVSFLIEFGDSALALKYRNMALNVFYKAYNINEGTFLGYRANLLADYLMDQGDFETAKKLFDKFLDEGGNLDEILPSYVRCLYMLSKWNEIVVFSSKILKKREDAELQFILGETYYNLGKQYKEMDTPDSALYYLNLLIQFGTPKIYLDDAHFLKGQIFYEMGEREKALEAFYKVLTIAPPRSAIARRAKEMINEIEKK